MKPRPVILFIAAHLALCECPPLEAAAFSSGSDGSLGPLNVTNDVVLTTPLDGIFQYTTINVRTGATVRFTRNEFNTPIYLLATGEVRIDGVIDVSGKPGYTGVAGEGGPGGFDGGFPPIGGLAPGDGQGPGGGQGGSSDANALDGARAGAFGSISTYSSPNMYGNSLLQPLIGGSGGGGKYSSDPGLGGGGGGGAILVASSSRITISGTGSIAAVGADAKHDFIGNTVASGSGGAIRLVAPVVAGNGSLLAGSLASAHGRGGLGRVRVDCVDRSGFAFTVDGRVTTGTEMVALPAVIPRLSIIEVAGQSVAEGTASTVRLQLPPDASTNQTVKLLARDFTGVIPVTVVVSPENGATRNFTGKIDMRTGNPGQTTINIVIPPGVINRIRAWTR